MKTKYKILIASILVLSMLTAFAVTSFAAQSTADITYDGHTYTYNTLISNTDYLQIWDYDTFVVVDSYGTTFEVNNEYIIVNVYENISGYLGVNLYYDNNRVKNYELSGDQYLNFVLTGNYKYGFISSDVYSDNVTNLNATELYQYDVWYDARYSSDDQINLLNNNEVNPLDKVNDFLGYLSTALTQLTTMIITNQILILFIVAVPVISFVIGSFKRIKDAGRV